MAPAVAIRFASCRPVIAAQIAGKLQAAEVQDSAFPPVSNRKRHAAKVPAATAPELGYLPCLQESQDGSAYGIECTNVSSVGASSIALPAPKRPKVLQFCFLFLLQCTNFLYLEYPPTFSNSAF